MHLKKITKIVLFTLAVIAVIALIYYWAEHFDIASTKEYVASYGSLSSIVLLLLIVITSSIGFISVIPVTITALLLNPLNAFFVSVLGLTLGALISFALARHFGRGYVERKYVHKMKKLERYDEHLKKSGFLTVLLLRMIIISPFELINVAAGLSRINTASYFFGTLVGIMPGIVLNIYLLKNYQNFNSAHFLLVGLILTAFALLPLLSKKIRHILFKFS